MPHSPQLAKLIRHAADLMDPDRPPAPQGQKADNPAPTAPKVQDA